MNFASTIVLSSVMRVFSLLASVEAAAAQLAELGCTEQEIMAITGHRTSKEIARYTRSADQTKRAERAMDKWSAKN